MSSSSPGRLAAAALILAACSPPSPPVDPAVHRDSVEAWRERRMADLRRPDGWLSLVGLYWLADGESTFGSDPGADLVYAGDGGDVPPSLGVFRVGQDGGVSFEPAPGVDVRMDGEPTGLAVLRPPPPEGEATGEPAPVLTWGPLRWHVIVRDGRPAVRLKSSESPVLTTFDGIDHYAVTTRWRLDGRLDRYEPARTILVPNILGTVGETASPGAAVFEVGGETYRLDLWRDSDDPANYFTAFGDATNGDGTYGGGRFLWIYAPAPGEDRIVVDFNRSYNPPCVFTAFATCPLPPRQNRLPFAVEAGEKEWEGHH